MSDEETKCPIDPYMIVPDKCHCVDQQKLKLQVKISPASPIYDPPVSFDYLILSILRMFHLHCHCFFLFKVIYSLFLTHVSDHPAHLTVYSLSQPRTVSFFLFLHVE